MIRNTISNQCIHWLLPWFWLPLWILSNAPLVQKIWKSKANTQKEKENNKRKRQTLRNQSFEPTKYAEMLWLIAYSTHKNKRTVDIDYFFFFFIRSFFPIYWLFSRNWNVSYVLTIPFRNQKHLFNCFLIHNLVAENRKKSVVKFVIENITMEQFTHTNNIIFRFHVFK